MALLATIQDGIGILTLNRPEVMNAVNRELLTRLHEQLQAWRFDRSVRAIVVTGAGDKAFSAGADLKERATLSPDEVRACVITAEEHAALAGTRRALLEVSGGITIENVGSYAHTGADVVSSGSLTNSSPVLDIGLDIEVG